MASSHKYWELPNSRILVAEIDIGRGLDFFILRWKSSKLKYKNVRHFLLFSCQSFMDVPKSLMTKQKAIKGLFEATTILHDDLCVKPGGYSKSFIRGGSAPRSNRLPFYIPFFQKRYPFRIPFIAKRNPFHIPS